jgi:hypothetical protein
MAESPAALQLRLMQTMVEVAAEKNSTLVLPFPVELLRFLERSTPHISEGEKETTSAPTEDGKTPELSPQVPDDARGITLGPPIAERRSGQNA